MANRYIPSMYAGESRDGTKFVWSDRVQRVNVVEYRIKMNL